MYTGPNIADDGLILSLDAANVKSYVSGSTTWIDLTRRGNSGSLVNGPTFNSSSLGSIGFDGVNDFISLSTFTGFGSTNRTISTWFRVTALPSVTYGRIISFPADDTGADTPAYTLALKSNGFLEGGFGGSPYNGYILNISYTLGDWVNIVASISSNTLTLYRNAIPLGQATNTGVVSSNPIGYLGRYNNNYGQYLAEQISNVQVYNRALSAQEVLQNYEGLKSRYGL